MRREVAASLAPGARLLCVTPMLPDHVAQLTVEVSLNGQQFTAEAARFNVTQREGEPPPIVPPEGAWGYTAERAMLLSFVPAGENAAEPTHPVFGPEPDDEM